MYELNGDPVVAARKWCQSSSRSKDAATPRTRLVESGSCKRWRGEGVTNCHCTKGLFPLVAMADFRPMNDEVEGHRFKVIFPLHILLQQIYCNQYELQLLRNEWMHENPQNSNNINSREKNWTLQDHNWIIIYVEKL